MTWQKLLIAVIAATTVISCGKNAEERRPVFLFNGVSQDSELTGTGFPIDLSDSACSYSVYLTARFLKNDMPDSAGFEIRIVSPSGKQGLERVTFPIDPGAVRRFPSMKKEHTEMEAANTSAYCDIKWKYRSGIRPKENGIWMLEITPENAKGLKGTGVIIEKNDNHER